MFLKILFLAGLVWFAFICIQNKSEKIKREEAERNKPAPAPKPAPLSQVIVDELSIQRQAKTSVEKQPESSIVVDERTGLRTYPERSTSRERPTYQKTDYDAYPKERGYTVYQIGNRGDGYIGVTSNFAARKDSHFNDLKFQRHANHNLQRLFNYGKIKRGDMKRIKSGLTRAQAYELEGKYRPYRNIGLNIAPGGE